MTTYEINIAKMYKESDWQGLPAHRFFARMTLKDCLNGAEADNELQRIMAVYPWPEFHATLHYVEQVRTTVGRLSNAPAEFLEKHGWSYVSKHTGDAADG